MHGQNLVYWCQWSRNEKVLGGGQEFMLAVRHSCKAIVRVRGMPCEAQKPSPSLDIECLLGTLCWVNKIKSVQN